MHVKSISQRGLHTPVSTTADSVLGTIISTSTDSLVALELHYDLDRHARATSRF